MKRRAQFDRRGALAIAASALGVELEVVEPKEEAFEARGCVAIVDIFGPLIQRHDPELPWDSYDLIRARVAAAVASPCQAVVLRVGSPGGEVAGCFELARDMSAMAMKSGKRLIAYADGTAASAAYALACSASEIWTSSTGCVGSIGVAQVLVETTGLDRAMGLNFAVVTSGARKADGNPHVEISDATRAAFQASVDGLAGLFFDHVAASRRISSLVVRGYEAGMFLGANAQAAGLVDGVCTFEQLLDMVSSGGAAAQAGAETIMDMEAIKAALTKAAEGEGEEAKAAKRMLAAFDKEPDGDEPPPKEDDEKATTAEDPAPPKKDDEKKDDEARASASAIARVGVLEREVASMKALRESGERSALLASRTDLTEGQIKLLSAQPLDQMRRTLAAFPAVAAPVALSGVRGKTPTQGSSRTSADDLRTATNLSPHAARLDEQMGLSKPGASITKEGDKLVCRTMTPTQARAYVKTLDARSAAQEAVK